MSTIESWLAQAEALGIPKNEGVIARAIGLGLEPPSLEWQPERLAAWQTSVARAWKAWEAKDLVTLHASIVEANKVDG
jgi:hypothetical protein